VRSAPGEHGKHHGEGLHQLFRRHSVFTSWEDGSSDLGPATPLEDRELNNYYWADSNGEFGYDSASDIGVSATAASGESFTAFLGLASEKDTNTCWYWLNATIL
jgi:hypothetical protein